MDVSAAALRVLSAAAFLPWPRRYRQPPLDHQPAFERPSAIFPSERPPLLQGKFDLHRIRCLCSLPRPLCATLANARWPHRSLRHSRQKSETAYPSHSRLRSSRDIPCPAPCMPAAAVSVAACAPPLSTVKIDEAASAVTMTVATAHVTSPWAVSRKKTSCVCVPTHFVRSRPGKITADSRRHPLRHDQPDRRRDRKGLRTDAMVSPRGDLRKTKTRAKCQQYDGYAYGSERTGKYRRPRCRRLTRGKCAQPQSDEGDPVFKICAMMISDQ